MKRLLYLCFVLAFIAGCKKKEIDPEPAKEPLSNQVAGNWRVISGKWNGETVWANQPITVSGSMTIKPISEKSIGVDYKVSMSPWAGYVNSKIAVWTIEDRGGTPVIYNEFDEKVGIFTGENIVLSWMEPVKKNQTEFTFKR